MRTWFFIFLVLVYTTMLSGCDLFNDEQVQTVSQLSQPMSPKKSTAKESSVSEERLNWLDNSSNVNAKEIEWDALIPEGWQPYELLEQYNINEMSDDDIRSQQLLDKLKDHWKKAPVMSTYDGKKIKIPGFVVPIEMDAKNITQFLLVPYYGACIHVPPPPANQTIYVVIREGDTFDGELFDTVWVTGMMRVERLSSDLAEAGYRLEGATVVPYE